MKIIFLFITVFTLNLYASLIGSSFSQRDLQILEDLDINAAFITDYKLQEVYQYLSNRKSTNYYLEKYNDATLFVPRIRDILRQENIPDVFIYMAMAESYFTIDAKSSARAIGLWQFMNGTAKIYGLRNDLYVDERMDLVKSTYAATKYLNRLHDLFGKWYLAAIAYNCGEGRVIEAITRATIDMYVAKFPKMKYDKQIKKYRKVISDYQHRRVRFSKLSKIYREVKKWNLKPDVDYLLREQKGLNRQYLPRESRKYIRKIISLAMLNSQNFIKHEDNSHLLNLGISTTVATIPVKGGTHLKDIAKTIGMDYKKLLKLNSHIKQSIIPPNEKYYTINIPYSRLNRFNQNKDKIKTTKFAIHVVHRGDTLYGISKKYKVPYKVIKNYNKLRSNRLSLRQKIILPIPEDMINKFSSNTKKSRNSKRHYVVKSGDSLYSIARKHKIDIKKIIRDNNLKDTQLRIGDKLVIR
ncbi:MAG: LysM peptidoglycan-binding domain-containing protein [Halarcobacter sp.]